MRLFQILIVGAALALSACAHGARLDEAPTTPSAPPASLAPPPQLRLASWNIAHLQADPNVGCHQRAEATFGQMRQFVRDHLAPDIAALAEIRDEAALRRIFPAGDYDVYLTSVEDFQPSNCGGALFRLRDGAANRDPRIREQRVALVIRHGVAGLSEVNVRERREFAILHEDPNGPDRPVRAALELTAVFDGRPIALLAVHLKSACHADSPAAPGRDNLDDCQTLFRQAPLIGQWLREQAAAGRAATVLGDFNRRYDPDNATVQSFWRIVEESAAAPALLAGGAAKQSHACRPQMDGYIDHFLLDARAQELLAPGSFQVLPVRQEFSDHCPLTIALSAHAPYSAPLAWVRNSAAYAALSRDIYAQATGALPHTFSRDRVVVMDADETILDNIAYQIGLEREGAVHNEPRFTRWGLERAAGAVPGALDYLRQVFERGGRIVVITNRQGADVVPVTVIEQATRENIARLYEAAFARPLPHGQLCVLGRADGADDKMARRRLVSTGDLSRCDAQTPDAAWSRRDGYAIAAFVGDQVGDFPCFTEADAAQLRQAADPRSTCDTVGGSSRFSDLLGRKYFLLPQPLYGGWARAIAHE